LVNVRFFCQNYDGLRQYLGDEFISHLISSDFYVKEKNYISNYN